MIWAKLWGSLLLPSWKEKTPDIWTFQKIFSHHSWKIYYLKVRIFYVTSRQLLKISNPATSAPAATSPAPAPAATSAPAAPAPAATSDAPAAGCFCSLQHLSWSWCWCWGWRHSSQYQPLFSSSRSSSGSVTKVQQSLSSLKMWSWVLSWFWSDLLPTGCCLWLLSSNLCLSCSSPSLCSS